MAYKFRPSIGPTVYHDENVDVKRPARVFYDDTRQERSRQPESVHFETAASYTENVRFEPEFFEANNSSNSLNRPAVYEKIRNHRENNKREFTDNNNYTEKLFMAEGNRPYVYRDYDSNNGNHRSYGRPFNHYSPPPNKSSYVSSNYGWSRVRNAFREPLSEFFGVFVLVLFGDGAIAQVVLSQNTKGDWNSIGWGYGIGIMLGVYTAGISGANINPAVTLANCIFRKQSWHTLPIYTLAQTLGAFCAAGVVYANYKSAIDVYEGGVGVRTVPGFSKKATAGIFATYPQDFMSRTHEFFNEVICSTILMFCIYMLQDKKNTGAGKLLPLILFFVTFGISASFGWQTGFAMNMARDFGPRLMTYCLGYGKEVWTASHHYFWIPMIAPFFGCLFGAWLYDMFLFTGDSPVNEPWMGLRRLIRPRQSDDEFV